MLQKIVPDDMMQPFNNAYSHGVVIPSNARTLYTSGQIGARPDGTLPADGAEQARNVWVNLLSVIRAARWTSQISSN
jgi:2-iminobutanoate/2-iminopropanoate deaminase